MVGLHTVTVAGADISCLVDSVSISHGRDDSGSQPEASSATIALSVDAAAAQLPAVVDVGAQVRVTTQTAGGVWDRFTGRVSDLALGWDDAGADTPDAGVGQIVAVGLLADLGRRVVGDVPWPQELDGARVARVLAAAGHPLDPLTSDPGTVELVPRDVDATQALDVAHDAAVSGTGVLWQTRSGQVRYADADHRRGIPSALTLDACDLLVTPTWRRTLEGLVNSVSLGYGTEPAGGGEQPRYVASNPDSITRWGTYGYSTTTALASLADAQAQGSLLLARNSSPVWVMAALPVDVSGLDAARYDALLGLDVHSLLTLTGLPALGTAPTSATLWVEGWKEELTWGGHESELVVSGYCRTVPPPRWDDVDPQWVWGGTTPVEKRRNLHLNPSVLTTNHYRTATAPATSTAAAMPPDGSLILNGQSLGYYRATITAPNGAGPASMALDVAHFSVDTVNVIPGQPFSASAYMRNSDPAATVRPYVRFHTSTGAAIGGVIWAPTTPIGGGTFVRVPIASDLVVPATAARVAIYLGNGGGAPLVLGQTCDVTAVLAEHAATVGTYFDGDTPDAGTLDNAWAGAQGASQSVQSEAEPLVALVERRRNLSVSPRANSAGGGWLSNNGALHSRTLNATPPVPHPLGIPTCVAVGVVAGGGAVGTTLLVSTYSQDGLGNSTTVRGQGAWVLAPFPADVRLESGGAALRTRIPANVWTYCHSGAAYSGYSALYVDRTDGQMNTGGETTYMTGSISEQGTVPPTYFDGDTPDTTDLDHSWTGTPGASASVQSDREPLATPPPSLLWDTATCFGPPSNYGRWNDQPATLRWDQILPATTWDNYQTGVT
jgi:hypothetical protein